MPGAATALMVLLATQAVTSCRGMLATHLMSVTGKAGHIADDPFR
jgi:hypothetical protein